MATQIHEALLRLTTVKEQTGLCRSAIYLLESRGQFPGRVAIGPRSVAWRQSEIQAWIESRKTKVAA
jgi:prophage regulatory protein